MESKTIGIPGIGERLLRSWFLSLSLGVALPLYLLGWISEADWNRRGFAWDAAVSQLLQRGASPRFDGVLLSILRNGDLPTVVILTAVGAVALFMYDRRHDAQYLARSIVGVIVLYFAVSSLFDGLPPHTADASTALDLRGSFPNRHALMTLALVLAGTEIGWTHKRRWLVPLVGSGYCAAVSLSAICLKVANPSEVVAAWLLAFSWTLTTHLFRMATVPDGARAKVALRFFGTTTVGGFFLFAGYVSSDLAHDNLRILVPTQAYRAGQMSKKALRECIQLYGIRSVLNLRGLNASQVWYRDEVEISDGLKIRHFDFGISSGRDVSLKEMENIVSIMREAPKPLLIHCAGGADRSGLAAALYLYRIGEQSPWKASHELSLWNGHVPILRSEVSAMDRSFWAYVSDSVPAELGLHKSLQKPGR